MRSTQNLPIPRVPERGAAGVGQRAKDWHHELDVASPIILGVSTSAGARTRRRCNGSRDVRAGIIHRYRLCGDDAPDRGRFDRFAIRGRIVSLRIRFSLRQGVGTGSDVGLESHSSGRHRGGAGCLLPLYAGCAAAGTVATLARCAWPPLASHWQGALAGLDRARTRFVAAIWAMEVDLGASPLWIALRDVRKWQSR